jgi:TetR/AcrR family transcriptional regulator, transcriptional repressor for nem operon
VARSRHFRLIFKDLTYILVGMLVAHERKRRVRDPERTRERLLQAAFCEVHRSGFQSASIDTILAATNVTKGALYYHFDSKEALGYAVIEEKIAKLTHDRWLRPMLNDGKAIDILIGVVRRIPARHQDVRAGCPLLLLSQEMSPLDEQFRKRLERIFLDWQEGIAALLRKGKSQGTVRRDLNPDEAASFLIATVEGYATLAKNAQDAKVWKAGVRNIVGWLKSLRAPGQSRRGGPRMLKKHVLGQRRQWP